MKSPFESALGGTFDELQSGVRSHLSAHPTGRRYRGMMSRVWRRRDWRGLLATPFLHLAARGETLFPETGQDIPFLLENKCTHMMNSDDPVSMYWKRQFFFPAKTRSFTARMHFDPERGQIVDWLGNRQQLEVEMHPRVNEGVFEMVSGRQWLRTRWGRIPLPHLFTGQARVREEETPDGHLKIDVTISNPMLGAFFGYEGLFTLDPCQTDDQR